MKRQTFGSQAVADRHLPQKARQGAATRPVTRSSSHAHHPQRSLRCVQQVESCTGPKRLRDAWLNPPGVGAAELKKRTLTNLYNQRPTWLDHAHNRLDAAVLAAYGWPADVADEDILARLLALNAAAHGAGPHAQEAGRGRAGGLRLAGGPR